MSKVNFFLLTFPPAPVKRPIDIAQLLIGDMRVNLRRLHARLPPAILEPGRSSSTTENAKNTKKDRH